MLPPVLFAVLGTTSISEKAPIVSAVAITLVSLLCVLRIYDAKRFPDLSDVQRREWKRRFWLTYLGCAVVFSALGCYIIGVLYGLQWEPMFFIAVLCGMTAGGVTAVVPDYPLMRAFIAVLLLPMGIACLLKSFYGPGVTMILFMLYMMKQGHSYSRTYWAGLRDRMRLADKGEALEAAMDELTEASERFRSAFETAPIGIGIIRSDGKLLQGNEQLARTLDVARTELAGLRFQDLFEPHVAQGFLESLTEGAELECEFVRHDGESVWAIFKAGEQPQKDEGMSCYIGQFIDITERKLAVAALQKTQKMQSLGVLAAGIAHEMNSPLQYVTDNVKFLDDILPELEVGLEQVCSVRKLALSRDAGQIAASEILELCPEPDEPEIIEEAREAISDTLEGLGRVSAIVASVKAVTHHGHSEMRPIDLKATLLNALEVSSSAWNMCVKVETDIQEDLPAVVGDEGELGQVFLNLIINAAQAIEECASAREAAQGRLNIMARQDQDFVEVRVSDSGDGIAKEIQTKIFDPFFTTKDVGKGIGQGLAVSRSVVSKHGGEISFETQAGEGTTFVVRLPLRAA